MDPWSPFESANSADDVARAWYVRLASGEARREDVVGLEQWLAGSIEHEAAFRRVRAVYGAAVAEPLAVPRRVERRRKRQRNLALSGVVSAVAVLFLTMPSVSWMLADHATRTGEVRQLDLPDGTIAYLDTDSALDVNYDDKARGVSLRQGRAWFKVAAGRIPFRVDAGGNRVTDIGTAFSVALPGDGALDVGVEDGIVDVRVNGLVRRLTKGMEGRFHAGDTPRVGEAPHDAFLWREGRLSFDGRPLGEVLATIGRYRPGFLYLTDKRAAERRVSATLFITSLDSGLAGLAESQHLRLRHITPWVTLVSPIEE